MPLCGEFWKSKEGLEGSLWKGLNNTATDSAEGFEALNKMVDPLEEIGADKWSLQTRKSWKWVSYTWKQPTVITVERKAPVPDHCRVFALSDQGMTCR